jgi:hypothetical protein
MLKILDTFDLGVTIPKKKKVTKKNHDLDVFFFWYKRGPKAQKKETKN